MKVDGDTKTMITVLGIALMICVTAVIILK